MKNMIKTAVVSCALLAIVPMNAHAFICTPVDEIGMFVDAMQEMNVSYQSTALQLSSDIGTMADRIVQTEELIGEMADRIVTTEALMAQLTLMLAYIAAGESVDPDLLLSIQDTVTTQCTSAQ